MRHLVWVWRPTWRVPLQSYHPPSPGACVSVWISTESWKPSVFPLSDLSFPFTPFITHEGVPCKVKWPWLFLLAYLFLAYLFYSYLLFILLFVYIYYFIIFVIFVHIFILILFWKSFLHFQFINIIISWLFAGRILIGPFCGRNTLRPKRTNAGLTAVISKHRHDKVHNQYYHNIDTISLPFSDNRQNLWKLQKYSDTSSLSTSYPCPSPTSGNTITRVSTVQGKFAIEVQHLPRDPAWKQLTSTTSEIPRFHRNNKLFTRRQHRQRQQHL